MSPDYADGGYSKHNGTLGDRYNDNAAHWTAERDAGALDPTLAEMLVWDDRAFVRENFTFHQGDRAVSREELFGHE